MKNENSARGGSAIGGKKLLSIGLAGCVVIAAIALTSIPTQAATKTIKDLIVKSTDSDKHEIKAVKNGHIYTIDTENAKKKKASKGSKKLLFSEIKDGDVLNVKGAMDSDRDVVATEVRDLSTTSSATMYGVVDEINSTTQTVKIKTTDRGELTVAILKSTLIKYDGKTKKFSDIREDDKVFVTGTWSSSKKTITKTKKFYILVKDDYSKLD
jgi:hypothetical protein